jgi:hypothetical protein
MAPDRPRGTGRSMRHIRIERREDLERSELWKVANQLQSLAEFVRCRGRRFATVSQTAAANAPMTGWSGWPATEPSCGWNSVAMKKGWSGNSTASIPPSSAKAETTKPWRVSNSMYAGASPKLHQWKPTNGAPPYSVRNCVPTTAVTLRSFPTRLHVRRSTTRWSWPVAVSRARRPPSQPHGARTQRRRTGIHHRCRGMVAPMSAQIRSPHSLPHHFDRDYPTRPIIHLLLLSVLRQLRCSPLSTACCCKRCRIHTPGAWPVRVI